jgi:hypothetical protein
MTLPIKNAQLPSNAAMAADNLSLPNKNKPAIMNPSPPSVLRKAPSQSTSHHFGTTVEEGKRMNQTIPEPAAKSTTTYVFACALHWKVRSSVIEEKE